MYILQKQYTYVALQLNIETSRCIPPAVSPIDSETIAIITSALDTTGPFCDQLGHFAKHVPLSEKNCGAHVMFVYFLGLGIFPASE